MRLSRIASMLGAAEARLWTGPAAHLIGGSLDFAQALARHVRQRRRERGAH